MRNLRKGIFKFIFIILVVVGSCYVAKESLPEIKLGLDLDGGVSITYQAKVDNPTPEQMSDAVYKLQLKAQTYSSEAEVYKEGNNKVNIDIPGVSDANAILEELGEPGTLYFVEGNLIYPEIPSTASNATPATNSNIQSILGDNVNIEGANVIQNPDGSITIGGDASNGGTILQSGSATNSNVQYDYDAPPEFGEDQIVVTGNDITSARGGMSQDSSGNTEYVVDLAFSEEGKQKFAEATARNVGNPIYIIYNGKVVSAPTVQSEITEGRAQINGMENLEAANILASTIRIGALPVELEEIRSNVVGAKLGEEAISTSLKAGLIGLFIICLFMIFVYRLPGFAAAIALVFYVALELFLIPSFEITLTLPGIAGIILSVGMAVDANVIIFTRIKEEIGLGKSVKGAVKEGFNRAMSAILDGNITTLIAALVLFFRGTGSVKGFASTLMLGIILSLFTALVITKFILGAFVNMGLDNKVLYGSKVDRAPISFVKFRRISYLISIATILIGLVTIGINASKGDAFEYGLDFKGGSSTNITFNRELSKAGIDSMVVPIFEEILGSADIQQQKVEGTNEVIIKSRTLTLEEREKIYERLSADESEGGFAVEESLITTENISGAVSTQMRMDATIAVIIATILMLIYIWIRFKDIRFASSAVLALLHDCIVTVGFYAIFRWTVDSQFIACMLTIVGYSINATIVIFDRIRENQGRLRGQTVEMIVNTSITQTFTRSINTSLTTLIMVVVLYILGVTSIKAFALPLIIGIISGCYSSIYITGPLWFDFKNKKVKNK